MPYNEVLADRIRTVLKRRRGINEKRMFGGIAFMVNGHMCVGIVKDDLCLRLGDVATSVALKEKHVRPMDFTGKPLKSMVYVSPKGFTNDDELKTWIERAMKFVKTLPAKK